MPLFVPFFVLLLNQAYVHSEVYDKVYTSKTECMSDVTKYVQGVLEKAPEGTGLVGGCIPLPEGTKLPADAPKKPQTHTGPTTSI